MTKEVTTGTTKRWGSGTLNIIDWCAENGEQKYRLTEKGRRYLAERKEGSQ